MIIDGKALAANIYDSLKQEIETNNYTANMVVVLVGNNPASLKYIQQKKKWAEYVGIDFSLIHLDANTTQSELLDTIDTLNNDTNTTGYIVQAPLPKHLDMNEVINAINPTKDIDGFHPENQGKLITNDNTCLSACTPSGIMHILKNQQIFLAGKHVVVIGRSTIVGKPLANMLISAGATLTVCNSSTTDISLHTKTADIVIAATGVKNLVTADMLKDKSVIIDVGFNFNNDGTICGDCDYENILEAGHSITPVPGGVGPLTVAMLMKNTIYAYKQLNRKKS